MKKIFRNLALGLAILMACPGLLSAALPDGSALFGITLISNRLVTIDPDTGTATTVGALGATAYPYGIGQRNGHLYTFDQTDNHIHEISKISGKFIRDIDVGLSGLKGEGDITFDSTGKGYLVTALNAAGEPANDFYLLTITEDANTGTAVRLGSTGTPIDALAFSSNGTLYGIGQAADATLYTIDTLTGAATAVGALGVDLENPISGMAFIEPAPSPTATEGTAVVEQLLASLNDRLYQVNVSTGAATPVDPDVLDLGVSSVSGLVEAPGAGNLGNISGRLDVGTGEDVGISGFIVRGTPDKTVVVRGIGPSLHVPGSLADPVVELFDSNGQSLAKNDNWRDGHDAEMIEAIGLAPTNDKEAALLHTLPAGNYTAILSGASNTTGIGLVEVYDTDVGSGSRLANLSTRGLVSGGDNALIGGIIVRGSAAQRVVARAIGPDLANRHVTNPLADPKIEIFNAQGTSIKSNDNYMMDPDAAEISSRGLAPANGLESATIVELMPGNYTAVVTAADGGSGVALVETFNLTTGEESTGR